MIATSVHCPRSSGENAASRKGCVAQTTPHLPPAIGVVPTDDDDIDRHAQIAQSPMQPHRLLSLVGDLGLDDQEGDLAMWSDLTVSVRAEQDHLRLGSSGRQATGCLRNQDLVHSRHAGIVEPGFAPSPQVLVCNYAGDAEGPYDGRPRRRRPPRRQIKAARTGKRDSQVIEESLRRDLALDDIAEIWAKVTPDTEEASMRLTADELRAMRKERRGEGST